jgi:glycosyltransferase involved in cell wall biosynthesis
MRITFVTPFPNLAGGTRVIAIYAEALSRRGHQVVMVSGGRRRTTLTERLRSLVRGGGWSIRRPGTGPTHYDGRGLDHRPRNAYGGVTDADVPDADVVIATWWETANWVAALSPSKGAKAYFIQHYETFDHLPKEAVDATWRLPLYKIVIARWLSDLARTKFGDGDTALVPNSVDLSQFDAKPRGKQAVPTVGFVYSSTKWKGCDVSLKAFELVSRQLPNARLEAFGLEELAASLPLPANSRYWRNPEQGRLREIYASCDVWLCGSRSEGFALPLLEAMACRCPVVSTRCGGPEDFVRDGVNGYLVPNEDHQAMAEKTLQILSLSDEEWRLLSDSSYADARKYTWDDAVRLFEAALFRLAERGRESPKTTRAALSP